MRNIQSLEDFEHVFFIGIAGAGMSALAQYLIGIGKDVSGSDRFFKEGVENDIQKKLEAEGTKCFLQDGSGMHKDIDVIVLSTAIEDTVPEVSMGKELGIPFLRRSEMLALISRSKKTIAIGGTSGKSTTAAMLYHILDFAKYNAGIISGAGLTSLIKTGKIGNAAVGKGDWLVIEADESDGSIVQYMPQIGVLLNVEKDHQEMSELMSLFSTFKENTTGLFIVNEANENAALLSRSSSMNFGYTAEVGFRTQDFKQNAFDISFTVNAAPFHITGLGVHTMENAAAAIAVACQIGVPLSACADALKTYEGIYRRHQVFGKKNDIWLIDDFAHNPAKCAASIKACQGVSKKVIAWFQPHGYAPTRFLKLEFIKEIADALRPQDEIWMSEIFYAGGTAEKNISAEELTEGISKLGKSAFFIANKNDFLEQVKTHLGPGSVLLLMGARDPGLEHFAQKIYDEL